MSADVQRAHNAYRELEDINRCHDEVADALRAVDRLQDALLEDHADD